ncbi:hypothetical protein PCANC_22342 [Puccinia coronata f. sp. avenae]|uniref:Uncharacterized protein n=1 Tax=Puccinia coronata f. sp. avenae TaxID=200324 RepID=A0A2N5SAQ7_9BASI|nr:hypothetical protein PCANC_22342 [Puccinia coronata f. sp. avenae]
MPYGTVPSHMWACSPPSKKPSAANFVRAQPGTLNRQESASISPAAPVIINIQSICPWAVTDQVNGARNTGCQTGKLLECDGSRYVTIEDQNQMEIIEGNLLAGK